MIEEQGLSSRAFVKNPASAPSSMPIAAKVHFGGSVPRVEQREDKVGFGETGLRDPTLAEPSKHHAALQCGRHSSQCLAAERLLNLGNHGSHPGFLVPKDRRGTENGCPKGRADSVLDRRNHLPPEPVAGVGKTGIRYILPIGDVMYFNKRGDFISREPEHGTNNVKPVGVGQRLHSRQASCSRSAKKVEEAGFDLIISVMGKKNAPAAMSLCAGLEKRVSQFSRCRLDGKFVFRCMSPNLSLVETNKVAEFSCCRRDERRISLCRAAAQAVVEMTNNELLVTEGMKAKQECHRIAST
jgi:hypothetical protein